MNINARGESLHLIAEHKYITSLFRSGGANLNAKDHFKWTPLHKARSKEIATLLIAKGADVNAKDNHGRTPLGIAVGAERVEVAALLRRHGARE
jgi:ankyrin repeat protein